MKGGSTPEPPDPVRTAEAQARLNKEAVYESARVNQVNQATPWGTSYWSGEIGDPNRTQTVRLNSEDQYALDQRRRIVSGLLGFADDSLVPQIRDAIGGGVDFRDLPGGEAFDYGDLPEISSGAELLTASEPLERATYERGLNLIRPTLDRRREDLESRLINQGMPIGSEIYDDAMGAHYEQEGNALENLALSSVGAGRAEQQRLYGNQLAARRMFGDEAVRSHGINNQLRNQLISEMMLGRTQPINELAMLLGQAPALQMPQFPGYAQYNVGSPDYMGMANANYQARAASHAQQSSAMWGGLGSMLGGLGGLIGGVAPGGLVGP